MLSAHVERIAKGIDGDLQGSAFAHVLLDAGERTRHAVVLGARAGRSAVGVLHLHEPHSRPGRRSAAPWHDPRSGRLAAGSIHATAFEPALRAAVTTGGMTREEWRLRIGDLLDIPAAAADWAAQPR